MKITKLLPNALRARIRNEIQVELLEGRERIIDALPKAALSDKHLQNCEILVDRNSMLRRVGSCQNVCELGVNEGEFSGEILRLLKPRKLHLVDTWGSVRYHEGLFGRVQAKFENEIAEERVVIHRMLSVESASLFDNGYFDFVYIDTDHSYSTTSKELSLFAPKISVGGIIAGHDFSMGNWVKSYRYGVIEAVYEFCVEYSWELLFLTANCVESPSFALRKMANGDD